jgi:RNA polymerase-interacting CarD/CdnL/TRCF family regulator
MAQDYRVREREISEAFAACSLKSLAKLIRDLYGRRARGKMSMREEDILEKAKTHFTNEYAVAVDTDLEDAQEILESALGQSTSSIES